MARHYLFTSESVTEGHPDKICDQISDAVLDAILAQDPQGRVACETTACTGLIHVMGEITTTCYVDIAKIAREVVRDIGYDRGKYGFDCDTCGVITSIDEQSADIALGVDKSLENKPGEDAMDRAYAAERSHVDATIYIQIDRAELLRESLRLVEIGKRLNIFDIGKQLLRRKLDARVGKADVILFPQRHVAVKERHLRILSCDAFIHCVQRLRPIRLPFEHIRDRLHRIRLILLYLEFKFHEIT